MNFEDAKCELVHPKELLFTAGGCHDSTSDCTRLASIRVAFVVSLPKKNLPIIQKDVLKGLLLLQLTNLTTNRISTFTIKIPEGTCNCESECYIQEFRIEEKIYTTVVLNKLIESDQYLLESCVDYLDH